MFQGFVVLGRTDPATYCVFQYSTYPLSASPFSSSNSNGSSGESGVQKDYSKLTAAQRARREEEERRIARMNDNVPGKTSAITIMMRKFLNFINHHFLLKDPSMRETKWN